MKREQQTVTSTKFLTFKEFQQQVGVSRDFLRAHLLSGEIRHVRSGKKFLILASEVEDWPSRIVDSNAEVHK